ncbi:inactive receptor-like protein kinase [Apostasia shenzhenica]|uniref:Inactive receptor-like protein kinase n=1 Tax=Apostasia shenzhenica TaxID=1088818 RepID=A0A2H9ZTH2_9ASPA|nr:inactive receptor-like protein kinase [Apostasia shenzhenica]
MAPISLSLLIAHLSAAVAGGDSFFANRCGERCGGLTLPYPFYLNSSCGAPVDAFRTSASSHSSRSSGALLLDYSSNSSIDRSPCDRWYGDLNGSAAILDHSAFFSITADNVLRLYDCEDSSVCKSGCERLVGTVAGCDGGRELQGCCYPLSDGSVWSSGEGFSVFAEYGCRGFSSWVAPPLSGAVARRGIEVEWAVPIRYSEAAACANGAVAFNATAVKAGVRCACRPGLVGDGFALGIGCIKACIDDGHVKSGDCCKGRLCKSRVALLTGVIISATFFLGSLAICFLVKRPFLRNTFDLDPICLPKILRKTLRTRLFTYQELNDATKGFDQEQELFNLFDGAILMGVIDDGSRVAVQKVNCKTPRNLQHVMEMVDILSQLTHKNIARIIGCCISSSHTLLVVHEFFFNGTLEEHLQQCRGNGLGWYHRVNIATEVASAFAFLQSEISTTINLDDLKTNEIFIGADYSIKIASFTFLSSKIDQGSCSYAVSHGSRVINNFGLILLELVTGSRNESLLELTLLKIKERRFDEIVDPYLGFAEQMSTQCKQIERVAGFAVQCLGSFVGESVSMVRIAKDFIQVTEVGCGKEPSLENLDLDLHPLTVRGRCWIRIQDVKSFN